jgi:ABC-type cobalamin/Fe3+-siderophores transport system ATPase subunit
VPFTNALIDLCQPLRLSVAVIGAHKSGKSSLIKGMARLLTE